MNWIQEMNRCMGGPTPQRPTRYYAVHAGGHSTTDLHGWDDRRIATHRQHDFSGGAYVHVIDSHTDSCAVCGTTLTFIQASKDTTCPGPRNVPVVGGIVGGSVVDGLKDLVEKYKTAPDNCQTGAEKQKEAAPQKDVLIAESAKPTTGIDWEAFKNFGKGL